MEVQGSTRGVYGSTMEVQGECMGVRGSMREVRGSTRGVRGSTRGVRGSTVNVPNTNSFFGTLCNSAFFKVLSHYKNIFFTYLSTEMSAASNDAKIP
jgi:hypothetical protein